MNKNTKIRFIKRELKPQLPSPTHSRWLGTSSCSSGLRGPSGSQDTEENQAKELNQAVQSTGELPVGKWDICSKDLPSDPTRSFLVCLCFHLIHLTSLLSASQLPTDLPPNASASAPGQSLCPFHFVGSAPSDFSYLFTFLSFFPLTGDLDLFCSASSL